jgi:cold-inducible RNA-binding protein
VKNIFVGNLDFNTSEDELRRAFEPYGQVDRVSILTDRDTGRSRGFGFVEMSNSEEGDKAITALNGSQIGGRTVNVNEARPKPERGGGGGGGGGRGGRGGDRVVVAETAGSFSASSERCGRRVWNCWARSAPCKLRERARSSAG